MSSIVLDNSLEALFLLINVVAISCSKFSQLSDSKKFENLSTIGKVTICKVMSSFSWITL